MVYEVSSIRPIKNEDANKEFFNTEEGTMVYHNGNKEFVIHTRKDPLM